MTKDLLERLNGPWHERANQAFLVIVLAHWAEHLAQAWQIWYLHWPRAKANGVLGLWYPWLVSSEFLHYAYAVVMLVGIWALRRAFIGRAKFWWDLTLWVQVWHHFEHALLIGQAVVGANLAHSPAPVSVLQFFIPRAELHLFYNGAVFAPMVVAMYFHMFPEPADAKRLPCTCAWHAHPASV